MKRVLLAAACACLLGGAAFAQGEEPYQCGYGGVNDKPVVPTAKVASAIFRAVVEGYNPWLLQRFPDITVRDDGDHWTVTQVSLADAAESRAANGGVMTIKNRGQMSLMIDKCIGTITKATISK